MESMRQASAQHEKGAAMKARRLIGLLFIVGAILGTSVGTATTAEAATRSYKGTCPICGTD
jgi:hypothetical protein